MNWLLLSILFSSVTVSFFKLFEVKNVNTFQAIIANYFTCSLIGSFFAASPVWSVKAYQADWLPLAFALGTLFISIFYCIALTAQRISVSASMVAAKLSVVIPVILAWLLYHEELTVMKISGILLSLISVYLISRREANGEAHAHTKGALLLILPLLVFLGSGCIDSLLNYLEQKYIPPYTADDIVTMAFFFAFVGGTLFMVIKSITTRQSIEMRSLGWGILLGIPNYFSMYFLVMTLGAFDATYIFPINNIGIVGVSTLIAFAMFKEKQSRLNMAGLLLSAISILLISLS